MACFSLQNNSEQLKRLIDTSDVEKFETLEQVRQRIDDIDAQLVELLNARVRMHVEQIKQQQKQQENHPSQVIANKQLLEQVKKINAQRQTGPLTEIAVEAIYKEIIAANEQATLVQRIAVAAHAGDFVHAAAMSKFGQDVVYECVLDQLQENPDMGHAVTSVWSAVQTGRAHYGVVPFSHHATGNNTATLSILASNNNHLHIIAEINMREEYCLLALGTQQLKRVYGSPEAIIQCSNWLNTQMPGIDIICETDMRDACRHAAENHSCAVLSGRLAAMLYKLDIIHVFASNTLEPSCRYLVISTKSEAPTGRDKTFVVFSFKDQKGALHDCLACFKNNNVNLTRIESRASRDRVKIWDYEFFADLEGHPNEPNVASALAALQKQCSSVRVLGSCPMTA